MIRYTLSCENDHQFESWFQSSAAFETLQTRNMVHCSTCGSTNVRKSIMAPAIPKKGKAEAEAKIAAIKEHVENNAENVGNTFYTEARAMHEGEKPERAIYGQANAAQAKSLIDDGISVLPLPFIPKKQTH